MQGKTVRCPACKRVFQTPAQPAAPVATQVEQPAAPETPSQESGGLITTATPALPPTQRTPGPASDSSEKVAPARALPLQPSTADPTADSSPGEEVELLPEAIQVDAPLESMTSAAPGDLWFGRSRAFQARSIVRAQPENTILFVVAEGCLLLSLIAVFLPWVSVSMFGVTVSVSGLQTGGLGIVQLCLSLGVGIFLGVAFGTKHPKLFGISAWIAAGWGVLGFLWRLLNLFTLYREFPIMGGGSINSGSGLFLSLFALLAVAVTCMFMAIWRLMNKG
jgi:hypothetical protein